MENERQREDGEEEQLPPTEVLSATLKALSDLVSARRREDRATEPADHSDAS